MLYPNRIKIVIISKIFFSYRYHDFFKFFLNRKEPELELEPQFVILAPATGGNLISPPRLSASAPQHCFLG
jgi:hypothetical protein